MSKSPISIVGGKFYLAKKILQFFPSHIIYVEPFGGGMQVMFRKDASQMEVYNDINSRLVNFFSVVKQRPEELFRELDFSLYSREVFCSALKNIDIGTDVERAAKFFIVNSQCFGGKMESWGVSKIRRQSRFFTYEERIRKAHQRLRKVYLENLDWREIICKYDSPETLFYCDPPYAFNGFRGTTKIYDNEMTDADHAELVETLKQIKGKFLLSGYSNSLYDCFAKIDLGKSNICVNKKISERRLKKQEHLWKNF